MSARRSQGDGRSWDEWEESDLTDDDDEDDAWGRPRWLGEEDDVPGGTRKTTAAGEEVEASTVATRPSADGSFAPSAFTNAFTNPKAGMEGVDKERVKKVVYEMSKDSQHFANESRKELAVESRIGKMRAKYERLSRAELGCLRDSVDAKVALLEAGRDSTKTWIHVDMDAFFAAVHMLERPELATVPMAVGGIGMISTANYEARKFGVRSAMPGFIALKLCPNLVFCESDFDKYRRYAALTREVFARYDPDFDAGSLDEAYLDVGEYVKKTGLSPADVACELRAAIRDKTGGLTCSAGVAPTRRLAKVCSDVNKPDGQMVLAAGRRAVLDFLAELPVRKVGGIGKVQERVLAAFGVTTCGDLLRERVLVAAISTPATAAFLLEVALGVGSERRMNRAAEGEPQRKSLSQERTFAPTSNTRILVSKVVSLAEEVAEGLVKEGLRARVVAIKLKLASFEIVQRQTALPCPTNDKDAIRAAATRLLQAEFPTRLLRLVGVRASQLEGGSGGVDIAAAGQARVDRLLRNAAGATAATENGAEPLRHPEGPDPHLAGVDDATLPRETAGTGADDATYLCLECGRNVPCASQGEHDDWHFALALQREDRAALNGPRIDSCGAGTLRRDRCVIDKQAGMRSLGGGAKGGKAKRKKPSDAQIPIRAFLQPAKRQSDRR